MRSTFIRSVRMEYFLERSNYDTVNVNAAVVELGNKNTAGEE